MDVRSTFDIGLYFLGAATFIGSVSIVAGAILHFEHRRRSDLRALLDAFSGILTEFGQRTRKDSEHVF